MERPYKYITALNYDTGQVYVFDYDEDTMPSAKELIENKFGSQKVHYMVHKFKPALWTADLYFCNREEAYRLSEGGQRYMEHSVV